MLIYCLHYYNTTIVDRLAIPLDRNQKGKEKEIEEVTVRATKNLLARQTPRRLLINTQKILLLLLQLIDIDELERIGERISVGGLLSVCVEKEKIFLAVFLIIDVENTLSVCLSDCLCLSGQIGVIQAAKMK